MIGTLLICATLLAVDGDTIKCNGVNMRDMGEGAPNVSGYDTPEIGKSKCDTEKTLGKKAKARMYPSPWRRKSLKMPRNQ